MTGIGRSVAVCRKTTHGLLLAVVILFSACDRLDVYTKTADLAFPDRILEECVHQTGERRRWDKAGAFRELRCNNAQQPGIWDIGEISRLIELETLDLSFNHLVDVTTVAKLPRLRDLDLGHNRIARIPGSTRFPVRSLNLDYNKVSDLAWLVNFRDLRALTLSHNDIRTTRDLPGLPELHVLDLSGNELKDVSGLSGLHRLREMNLANNAIRSIDVLAGLTRLENLDLSRNSILDLAPLAGIASLVELDLSDNPINDIQPVAQLVNLEKIILDNTRLISLAPLLTLGRLEEISLRRILNEDCNEIARLQEVFGSDAVILDRACPGVGSVSTARNAD